MHNLVTGETKTQTIEKEPKSKSKSKSNSGLTKDDKSAMENLVNKLFILLISNVGISLFCLIILFRDMAYAAGCLDMLVSNICLWLAYRFNNKYYNKICAICICCCNKIETNMIF